MTTDARTDSDSAIINAKSWQENLDTDAPCSTSSSSNTYANDHATRLHDTEKNQHAFPWEECSSRTVGDHHETVIPGVVRHGVQNSTKYRALHEVKSPRTNREANHLSRTMVKRTVKIQKWNSNISFHENFIAHTPPLQNSDARMEEDNANVERPLVRHATTSHSLAQSRTCNEIRVDTTSGGHQRTSVLVQMVKRQSEGPSPSSTHSPHLRQHST